MKRVRFGKTELSVSRLGLGCHSFGTRHLARGWDPFTKEGRSTVHRTIHAALDGGINFFDTSPDYGDGHSETLLGEALKGRRNTVVIATKVPYSKGTTSKDIESFVTASLQRLNTDYIDIIQFHGGNYPKSEQHRILEGGLLEALCKLRDRGLIGNIGFTVVDPVTAKEMINSGTFSMVQLLYHIAEQAAARHALNWSREQDLGITVMRPLTAGTIQLVFKMLAPEWSKPHELNEFCLKYLLSDSRLHMINVGMRWDYEVINNVELFNSFQPPFDVAELTHSIGQLARMEDLHLQYGIADKAVST